MPRICFDLQPLISKRSGVGWYTYNIINNIEAEDMLVQGMCFDFLGRNNVRERLEDIKAENLYINKWLPSKVYRLLTGLLPVNYDWFFPGGDIYHYFNFTAPSISRRKKVIITIHDMVYKILPETVSYKTLYILNREMERSVKRADAIITVSENSRKDILRFHDVESDRISIVNPGIDYDFFKAAQDMDGNTLSMVRKKYNLPDRFILYLGTIEPRKNITALVGAYEKLPEDIRREFKLVIAGGVGWKADGILKRIKESPEAANIMRIGYVDEADKHFIYGAAAVFVFPSLYEGFGIPVIEAMASGTPVVTSSNSSLPEAGGDAALYSDANDIEAISDNILRVLTDKELEAEMIRRGMKHAASFSWKKSAGKTVEVYRRLLEEK